MMLMKLFEQEPHSVRDQLLAHDLRCYMFLNFEFADFLMTEANTHIVICILACLITNRILISPQILQTLARIYIANYISIVTFI